MKDIINFFSGLVMGYTVYKVLGILGLYNEIFEIMTGAIVGAVLPNIDNKNTALGEKVLFISKRLNSWRIFHVPAVGLGIAFAIFIFYPQRILFIFGFLAGYLNHLFLQCFLVQGLPLKVSIRTDSSGSHTRKVICFTSIRTAINLSKPICYLLLAGVTDLLVYHFSTTTLSSFLLKYL